MNQPINTPKDIIQYDYYLSGPMSGIKYYNFPEFNRVTQSLRDDGYTVFNPAETFGGETNDSYTDYLRVDTIAIARCKKMMMLPGWRRSKGACFEYLVAKTLDLEIDKFKYHHRGDKKTNYRHRVALLGYARTGKDSIGSMLIDKGYERIAIGDYIKSQLDPVISAHLGHSAFTEDNDLKENIRETLVHFGYANYENILNEFMEFVPPMAVNTRLYRYKEALAWKELEGAEIWLVTRPGFGPKEPKVKEELDKILDAGLLTGAIENYSSMNWLNHIVKEKILKQV